MSRDGGGRSSQGHLGGIPGGGSRFPEFDMFPQGGDGAARIYFSNADVTLNFIPLALFAFILLYILGRTNLLGSLFSFDGMLGMVSGLDFSGSSSSYGAPDPGYGAPAPAPAPSYSAPAPSYNEASAKSDKEQEDMYQQFKLLQQQLAQMGQVVDGTRVRC